MTASKYKSYILYILLPGTLLLSCTGNQPSSTESKTPDSTQAKPADITDASAVYKHTDTVKQANQIDTLMAASLLFKGKPILIMPVQKMGWLLIHADSITTDTGDVGKETIYWLKHCTLGYVDSNLIYFRIYNSLSITIHGKEIKMGDKANVLKELFPNSFALQKPPPAGMTTVIVNMGSFDLSFDLDLTGKIIEMSYNLNEDY